VLPDLTIEGLSVLLRAGGLVGVFAYTLMWLLRRGDQVQRENMDELRRQRDHYRKRAEQAETEHLQLIDELEKLRSEQQVVRHRLKSEREGFRMEAEVWRRRAVECGWTEQHG
jgi:predicted nuclease with TOPRIM domain